MPSRAGQPNCTSPAIVMQILFHLLTSLVAGPSIAITQFRRRAQTGASRIRCKSRPCPWARPSARSADSRKRKWISLCCSGAQLGHVHAMSREHVCLNPLDAPVEALNLLKRNRTERNRDGIDHEGGSLSPLVGSSRLLCTPAGFRWLSGPKRWPGRVQVGSVRKSQIKLTSALPQDGGARNGFDLNVVAAWKMGFTGKGIVITILDDGLEKDHPDLQANYVSRLAS